MNTVCDLPLRTNAEPDLRAADAPPLCPLCTALASPLFAKDGIPIHECRDCSHRFAVVHGRDEHIEAVYGDGYFEGGGAGYRDYLSEGTLLREHGQRYGRLLRRFAATGRLLDVGAAAGFVLQGLRDAGWEGEGVEPNETMARHACEQLGLTVSASAFEGFHSARPFDAVSLIQVVAHFVDPLEAVRRVAELLRPGGLCLVETWNVRSWTARLFGQQWHEYSPPSVLQWFSPATLTTLFDQSGLTLVERGRPQKWLNAGHAKSLLRHAGANSPVARIAAAVASVIPDRVAIPYPSEDLFWAVFQKRVSP